MSPPGNPPKMPAEQQALALLESLDRLELRRYVVTGHYLRFDPTARQRLKEFRQSIHTALRSRSLQPKNFLLWGVPGSGKSYLVEQIAASCGPEVEFRPLNLARLDRQGLLDGLDGLAKVQGPLLCLIDEIDAHGSDSWPYEVLLPYLEPTTPRPSPTCFCLAGSGGRSPEEFKAAIRERPKGRDLLSRVPVDHELVVPPLDLGDRILVATAQVSDAAAAEGRPISEIEKLALFYIAVHERYSSPRQLRSLASECAQRLPVGATQLRYDYLFSAGDAANKEFWAASRPVHRVLVNKFVEVDITGSGEARTRSREAPPTESVATSVGDKPVSDRLAVLPFANISPDPKDEYIADGLTEELITVLAQLQNLRVISRTSVMAYRATPKPASQIGTELGVSALLEGSVRRAGNRLRITAQLIEVRSDRHLWARTFDRELDDVFAVQSEIAKQVADALGLGQQLAVEARLESRPPVRPESYLAYLRGMVLLRDTSSDSLHEAQRQFETAISLDPGNAGAYGALAIATWFIGLWHIDPSQTDWVEKVRASAARALELDPNLPDAHLGMTPVLFRAQNYGGMEREFRVALSLNPSHALAHNQYANILEFTGRAEEALTEFRLAEAADPLWSRNLIQLATLLVWLRRLDEARETLEKLGRLAPSNPDYHFQLGEYHFAQDDVEKGLAELRLSEDLEPGERAKQITRAWILGRSGKTEQAKAILRREETLPLLGQLPFSVAQIYAELGDLDECFRWLEKSFLVHDLPVMGIRLDPRYENIRRDPRYHTLLEKMNLA